MLTSPVNTSTAPLPKLIERLVALKRVKVFAFTLCSIAIIGSLVVELHQAKKFPLSTHRQSLPITSVQDGVVIVADPVPPKAMIIGVYENRQPMNAVGTPDEFRHHSQGLWMRRTEGIFLAPYTKSAEPIESRSYSVKWYTPLSSTFRWTWHSITLTLIWLMLSLGIFSQSMENFRTSPTAARLQSASLVRAMFSLGRAARRFAFALPYAWICRFVFVLCLAGCVVLECHDRGIRIFGSKSYKFTDIQPDSGLCYYAAYGDKDLIINERTRSLSRVLENGVELAIVPTCDNVRHPGPGVKGCASFFSTHVAIAASDGSDPRTNGYEYTVIRYLEPTESQRFTLQFTTALMAWLTGLTFFLQRRSTSSESSAPTSPTSETPSSTSGTRSSGLNGFWMGLAVFFVALGIQTTNALLRFDDPALAKTGMSILGKPFTDAFGWHLCGNSLSQGQGMWEPWNALRPGYAVFLGCVYLWTGSEYFVALGLNVLLSALTAALMFQICRRLGGMTLGLSGAALLLFDSLTRDYVLISSSETLGLFLTVYALFRTMVAAETFSAFGLIVAGGLLAAGNLVRPLTLISAPLILLWLASLGWTRGYTYRRIGRSLACYSLGIGIVLGPWLLRQQIVHGILSVSDNTAPALYAAACPKYGAWVPAVYHEIDPNLKTHGERYDAYMKLAKSHLKSEPMFYVQNVSQSFERLIVLTPPWFENRLWIVLPILIGLGLGGAFGWRSAIAVPVIIYMLLLLDSSDIYFTLLCFGSLALVRRRERAIIPITLFSCLFGLAMFGFVNGDPRLLLLVNWIKGLTIIYGLKSLFGMFVSEHPFQKTQDSTDTHREDTPIWYRTLRMATWIFFLVSAAIMTHRHVVTNVPPSTESNRNDEEALAVLKRFQREQPTSASIDPDGLGRDVRAVGSLGVIGRCIRTGEEPIVVIWGRVAEFVYHLPVGLDLQHWFHYFEPRSYNRSVFLVYPEGMNHIKDYTLLTMVIMPNDLPQELRGSQCLTIARVRIRNLEDGKRNWFLEGLAMVPLDPATHEPIWERIYAPEEPRHRPYTLPRSSSFWKDCWKVPAPVSKKK